MTDSTKGNDENHVLVFANELAKHHCGRFVSEESF